MSFRSSISFIVFSSSLFLPSFRADGAPFNLRFFLLSQIAPYFAKVECFCFEEQQILANEEVDLPVFFFIDRDVLE